MKPSDAGKALMREATGALLREVPKVMLAGIKSGNFGIYGSIIRNTSTGRIVGFLQEAAPVAKLIANAAGNFPNAGLLVANTALQAGQLVQGEVIRRGVNRMEAGVGRVEDGIGRIEGRLDQVDRSLGNIQSGVDALHQLGLANLAVSTAGIGVSIVGFAIMSAKLDRISNTIHGLAGQMGAVVSGIEAVQQDLIDADFAELKSLAKAMDESWLLSEPAAFTRCQDVAHAALRFQSKFEQRAERLLTGGPANFELADPMLDAVSFASGLRVAALAACNEGAAATEAAADGARAIERLTGAIGLADLAGPAIAASGAIPGTQEWTLALAEANSAARETVARIRQREAAAATRAAPLASLERRGIRPRDWMLAARGESEAPLLIMLEEDADESDGQD